MQVIVERTTFTSTNIHRSSILSGNEKMAENGEEFVCEIELICGDTSERNRIGRIG